MRAFYIPDKQRHHRGGVGTGWLVSERNVSPSVRGGERQ